MDRPTYGRTDKQNDGGMKANNKPMTRTRIQEILNRICEHHLLATFTRQGSRDVTNTLTDSVRDSDLKKELNVGLRIG